MTLALDTQPPERTAADGPELVESAAEIAALAIGAPDVVEAFYRRHFDVVFAFVFHRVGGLREDAEDVVQETFLTALRQLGAGAFERRSSLRTWLLGIAKNKAHEKRRAGERDRPAGGMDDAAIARALGDIEAHDVTAEVAHAEQAAHLVGAALAALPDHYRRALTDKYVEGRSVGEMAARASRTPKSVESTLQRARVAFDRALTDLGGSR